MTSITRTIQVAIINIFIAAIRGWCLKYVDDGVNAPARQARAIYSYNVESRNGNIRTGDLPVGVRVPGFLGFSKGAYVDYGHVFWAEKQDDGSVLIDDSEVHAGARGQYHSIAELLAWFGAYGPTYLGYSLWLDGVQIAQEVVEEVPDPTPAPEPTPAPAPSGAAIGDTVTTSDTHDAQNGLQLDLAIINDGQSVWTENNSNGFAVLRKGDIVRAAVHPESLSKV